MNQGAPTATTTRLGVIGVEDPECTEVLDRLICSSLDSRIRSTDTGYLVVPLVEALYRDCIGNSVAALVAEIGAATAEFCTDFGTQAPGPAAGHDHGPASADAVVVVVE
jgi:hypothetical protein